jgi:hypothetical protein
MTTAQRRTSGEEKERFNMSESILQKIERETGCELDQIARIVALALRDLHLVAATKPEVTTAALVDCYYNFGTEACYHLGGLLAYHDYKTNQPDAYAESLMPETMQRLLGGSEDLAEVRDRWLACLKSARAIHH